MAPNVNPRSIPSTPAGGAASRPQRFFFFSDSHVRFDLLERVLADAQRERPDLVIDGGDVVDEGTEPEFRKAQDLRARAQLPLRQITGNHDLMRSGPFEAQPGSFPSFQSFDQGQVHFILLDNSDEHLTEDQFQRLDADLAAHADRTTIVAMHVPPFLSRPLGIDKLKALVPSGTAHPSMPDAKEVARFTALMSRYHVAAVLSGHTHKPDYAVREGVPYVVVGSAGGLIPEGGVGHEYLDITVQAGKVDVKRVPLDKPAPGLLGMAVENGAYLADENSFNHEALGWDQYVPAVSLQWRAGLQQARTGRGASLAGTVGVQLESELDARGKNALFGEGTLEAGARQLGLELEAGYKRRVLGDYNANLFLDGAATVNAGALQGKATGGVGLRLGTGIEFHNWTVELSQEMATNRQETRLGVGFRF